MFRPQEGTKTDSFKEVKKTNLAECSQRGLARGGVKYFLNVEPHEP